MHSKSPEKNINKDEEIEKMNNDSVKNFSIFGEEKNINILKELSRKGYNVIFSSNPQSGNNSKKSINGFAYIFL